MKVLRAAAVGAAVLSVGGSALAQQARDVVYIQANGRQLQVTNAKVTSVSSGVFTANTAIVGPGATITVTGSYVILPSNNQADFFCPGCVLQSYIAWTPAAVSAGASPVNVGLWFGQTTVPGQLSTVVGAASGTFSFTTTAPNTPGFYTIGAAETLDFNFVPTVPGTVGYDLAVGVAGNPTTANFLISVVNAAPTACTGDANADQIVNFSDISTVLANFGAACP